MLVIIVYALKDNHFPYYVHSDFKLLSERSAHISHGFNVVSALPDTICLLIPLSLKRKSGCPNHCTHHKTSSMIIIHYQHLHEIFSVGFLRWLALVHRHISETRARLSISFILPSHRSTWLSSSSSFALFSVLCLLIIRLRISCASGLHTGYVHWISEFHCE